MVEGRKEILEDLSDETEEELSEIKGKELEDLDKEIEEDLELDIEAKEKVEETDDVIEGLNETEDEEDDFLEEKKEKKKRKKEKKEKVKKEKTPNPNKKKIIIIIVSLCSIMLILGAIIAYKLMTPIIKLHGKQELNLTINSEYVEKGAKAKFVSKDISKDIKITGEINPKKEGTYTIKYSVKKGIFKNSKKRIVNVSKAGPIITLEGDKELSICPEAKYEELGFKATGEKDKDLTKKVLSVVKKDKVTYSVEDNNKTFIITRKLIREDKEAPEIKLNGSDHVYVTINMNYSEQGANATDKCDGDLNDKIKTEGNVDTKNLGDYELTYKVADKAGNESSVKRTVSVIKEVVKRSANLGCGEPGVIYLTFDDGPGGSTTSILNTLKKHNVKATFFVSDANGGSDDLIKREADEGHLVALHTSSHEYSRIYKSIDAYYEDLNKISARVERITGKKAKMIRFPGGSSNTVSRRYMSNIMSILANDVESKGYSYFDWNVDSRDAENKPCDEVYRYATGGLSKSSGNVVLMHDIKSATACALDRIIQFGKDNGYTFKTLDSSITCHHKTAN